MPRRWYGWVPTSERWGNVAICRDTQQLRVPGQWRPIPAPPPAWCWPPRTGAPSMSIASITSTVATKHRAQAARGRIRAHQGISWLHHEPDDKKAPSPPWGPVSGDLNGRHPLLPLREKGMNQEQTDTLSPRERVKGSSSQPLQLADRQMASRRAGAARPPWGKAAAYRRAPGSNQVHPRRIERTQGTLAGLPSSMPGNGTADAGAKQQAPHPRRHSM